MKCPVCSSRIPRNEKMCPNCGFYISDLVISEVKTKKEEKKLKANKVFNKLELIRIVIVLGSLIIAGIPVMMHNFISNIENSTYHYGTYSIEEFKQLNIESSSMNLAEEFNNNFNNYLLDANYDFTYESTIYYLKDSITSKLYYYLYENNNPVTYTVTIEFDEYNKTNHELCISYVFDGNISDSISYINKDRLEYIADYLEIDDCYEIIKEAIEPFNHNNNMHKNVIINNNSLEIENVYMRATYRIK